MPFVYPGTRRRLRSDTVDGRNPANQLIWVFPKIGGKPPKWMVKIMENPIRMDELGVPLFLETSIW